MMLKTSLLLLGVACLIMAGPASAQITNIDDIQAYDATGLAASPLAGLPVTVRGVVTVIKNTYNGGTHYIQDPTGGINFFDSGAPVFAIGDTLEVAGTVGAFFGEINLSPPFTYNFINTGTPPAPLALTVGQALDFDNDGLPSAGDYEHVGMLVSVTGTVAFLPPPTEPPPFPLNGAQGSFGLTDGADTLIVFIDRTTAIDPAAINNGDLYQITSPMTNFNGLLELKPRFQADLVENPSDPFPIISNVTPTPWTPIANQAVTVSADISDNGTIVSANLFYRHGSVGSFTQLAMVDDGFGNYSATIPGTTMGNIDYYVVAEDNSAQVTSVPGDAPASNLSVAVGTTSIIDIESMTTASGDTSAFFGQLVNIEALVTVAPGEIQTSGLSNYVVGDAAGGPWSGIFVFEGSGANIFLRGDKVRISGRVSEFNGITEIQPQRGDAVELISFGNALPPLRALTTQTLDNNEKWESVVVGTLSATVVDTVFAGVDWWLKDAVSDSAVYVDPAPAVTFVSTLGDQMFLTGFMDTRFGRNEMVPLTDDDIILESAVGNEATPTVRQATIESASPNPFNPSTKIEFSVPRKGLVELAIFNSRGERVRTLLSGELEAGNHEQKWNGRDDRGHLVGSGVYYGQLRFETESVSVTKLTLVK